MFVNVLSTFLKYLLHTIDLQSENPWENKGIVMLYGDLILGFSRVILYLTFMSLMVKIHTFPLFAIRPMYLSLRSFKKTLNDVIMSRRAIRNLNIMYPDVTQEQLRNYSDTICIICREEMSSPNGINDTNQQIKKLPCDHIFHKNCLRSWFQRQQTCPTCRTSILRFANQPHTHQQNNNNIVNNNNQAQQAQEPPATPAAAGAARSTQASTPQPSPTPQQQSNTATTTAAASNNQLFNLLNQTAGTLPAVPNLMPSFMGMAPNFPLNPFGN